MSRISFISVFATLMFFVNGSWAQDYRQSCGSLANQWFSAARAVAAEAGDKEFYQLKDAHSNADEFLDGSSKLHLSSIESLEYRLQLSERNLGILQGRSFSTKSMADLMLSRHGFYVCVEKVALNYARERKGVVAGADKRSNNDLSGRTSESENSLATTQSLGLAQQNQSRGDEQAKKDGRKRNDSAYEAHNCLTPDDLDNPRSYGSLRNSCGYKVEFHFCVLRPNASSWSTAYDCEKQSFGGGSAGAGGRGPVQIKGAQSVLWFACRSPAFVVDQRYDAAQGGLTGRCRVIGG